MKTNVYLVQRLNKPTIINNPFSFGGGLLNGGISKEAMAILKSIFSFDYMGSAEFEFGAVPAALDSLSKKDLTTFTIDNLIWGICPKEIEKDVIEWIKNAMINQVCLKEHLGLIEALRKDKYAETKGWLRIENSKPCEEPFMFFIDKSMFDKMCIVFKIK